MITVSTSGKKASARQGGSAGRDWAKRIMWGTGSPVALKTRISPRSHRVALSYTCRGRLVAATAPAADSAARRALEVNEFPTATFVSTEPVDLGASLGARELDSDNPAFEQLRNFRPLQLRGLGDHRQIVVPGAEHSVG